MRSVLLFVICLLGSIGVARADPLAVSLNVDTARAVLAAVRDPNLTEARALAIAKMPGSAGLIRKIKSYGRQADEAMLAQALLAAAQHRVSDVDKNFRFAAARDAAPAIGAVLDQLTDPSRHVLDDVKQRIALFTPPSLSGTITGYLIVGGTSGGFAFGDPEFYLDLAHFPSAPLASTILEHELFHAVQALAAHVAGPVVAGPCRNAIPGAARLDKLFDSLVEEGTASYVGDVLALSETGDAEIVKARAQFQHGQNILRRSVTLLELSVHAVTTGASISDDDIYSAGFYDDEILYSLGYVVTRAIAREQGPGAVAELLGKPGALFVQRYVALKSYGTPGVPKLFDDTVRWGNALGACR